MKKSKPVIQSSSSLPEVKISYEELLQRFQIKDEADIARYFELGLQPYWENKTIKPCPVYCHKFFYAYASGHYEKIKKFRESIPEFQDAFARHDDCRNKIYATIKNCLSPSQLKGTEKSKRKLIKLAWKGKLTSEDLQQLVEKEVLDRWSVRNYSKLVHEYSTLTSELEQIMETASCSWRYFCWPQPDEMNGLDWDAWEKPKNPVEEIKRLLREAYFLQSDVEEFERQHGLVVQKKPIFPMGEADWIDLTITIIGDEPESGKIRFCLREDSPDSFQTTFTYRQLGFNTSKKYEINIPLYIYLTPRQKVALILPEK